MFECKQLIIAQLGIKLIIGLWGFCEVASGRGEGVRAFASDSE